ncbi:MAG: hypothetical protein IJ638_02670 [Alphaproteobacteria bacterium]|nr:hypothetical protein [Alphaproteobacteria bacterium]
MKQNKDKIIAIFESSFFKGYIIKIGFESGKQIFLAENEETEGVMSFSKFKNILKENSLDELYSLKDLAKTSFVVKKFIDDELRRRHKSLKKNSYDISNDLKSKKEKITLQNGETLIRASQVKEK